MTHVRDKGEWLVTHTPLTATGTHLGSHRLAHYYVGGVVSVAACGWRATDVGGRRVGDEFQTPRDFAQTRWMQAVGTDPRCGECEKAGLRKTRERSRK